MERIKDLCRICVNESLFFINIFDQYTLDTRLYELINGLCQLDISVGDGLPEFICADCYAKLCELQNFKNACHEGKAKILGIMGSNEQVCIKVEPIDSASAEDDSGMSRMWISCGDDSSSQQKLLKTEPADLTDEGSKGAASSRTPGCNNGGFSPRVEEVLGSPLPCIRANLQKIFGASAVSVACNGVGQVELEDEHPGGETQEEDPSHDGQGRKGAARPQHDAGFRVWVEPINNFSQQPRRGPDLNPKGILAFDHRGAAFSHQGSLNPPSSIHPTPEDGERCDVCHSVFPNLSELGEHLRSHLSVRPFVCDTCRKCFSRKWSLIVHLRSHNGVKPYPCEVCRRRFSFRGNLKTHMRTHTGIKPFTCEVCHKSFSQSGSLKIHSHIHSGDRPFPCSYCDKAFCDRSTLTKHLRIHTGDKPYPCPYCTQRFSEKGNLRNHIRKHTGDRPHECRVCGKNFANSSNLNAHTRIHTGHKPFGCPVCGKRFSQNSHMKTHLKIH